MWQDWTGAGFPPGQFWHITLREYRVIMQGASARFDRERALVQYQAWLSGQLTAIATHSPGSYPAPEKIIDTGNGRRAAQSDDEIERMIRFMHTSTTGEIIQ
ncbi:hypothetical protein [Maritimibacter sp. DP1N21-5]|uniref:hypothetical protein n=1 Tax=Maritimibacter sp. DP1N21-5 TaxID=2836867 RepID=UPI001C441F81|nr:hypothetical protein [Maritimibacter sp. DP1N21-5]MBV7408206.1 hypothetical protein [Maritimibacter sp. DP1N21-5]